MPSGHRLRGFHSSEGAAIHAALNTAVDPFLECAKLVLATDKSRKDGPGAGKGKAETAGTRFEMTALAFQTVARGFRVLRAVAGAAVRAYKA
jgi:hypothetical protein